MKETGNIRRIAKNTFLLYFRLIISMLVSLYTARVVLNTLGVIDYGIYNVVGGFVTMFGFLNGAMSSSTQRFLSFELGRENTSGLRKVFIMSINIHFIIALVILLLAETVGMWFLDTQMTIIEGRKEAALWVYQFSILSLILTIISVPYNAIIIAHERMGVYAWMTIIEVILRLLIVFILVWYDFDKLKLYAVLFFIVSLVIRLIYGFYCKFNFKESKFYFYWNKPMFKTLIGFAGWNLWGSMAYLLRGQGVNVLLNIFFGPTVNAARGIAFQINNAINQFVSNFQMAVKPQIIKSYASDNISLMNTLVFQGAKYSFFLLFILSLPLLFETEIILKLWLKIVPEYTVIFTRLVIVGTLIDCISGTLMTAAQASGKIKIYQSIVGGLLVLNLPISYFFLKLGYEPQITLYISIVIYILALIFRLIILRKLVNLRINVFLKQVLLRILYVTALSVIIPSLLYYNMDSSIERFLLTCVVSVVSVLFAIYFSGLNNNERKFFSNYMMKFFKTR